MSIITEQQKIGSFIKSLRERKGWSQAEFAKRMETSQSAVARMEKGEQNFTTEMLSKISEVMNHQIVSLSSGSVDFKITGGKKLSGAIETNTSKNGAMGLMCASLLNKGKTILHGIPRIEEVFRIIEVMESIGVDIKWAGAKTLEIQPPVKLKLDEIAYESAATTRTILMFIGPIAHLFNKFSLPHSQGCKLGKRTASAHIFGLEELGINVEVTNTSYEISSKKMQATNVVMYEAGDTAVENILLAAAKIKGKTIIKFASSNYMVQDVCFFLQSCGVKVEGIGSQTLTVHGVEEINQTVEHHNSEDPIESMMFLSAAIVTKSEITIKRAPIDFLELELYKLKKMGFKYTLSDEYVAKNGQTRLIDITTKPSELTALPDKITCGAYPDVNMDNLPFFVPIAAVAQGQTLIHDWVYENRAIYYMELTRLNAQMILADPHRVIVEGSTVFKPAQVVCPPALRPAMIVLIGMLAAKGTSILRNVYSISRGYEEIAARLNSLGAEIEVLNEM